ncbi:MAG: cytochrome P460 family protein, partial [Thermoleophilia bacterium]|nr:cytochrome P460 family protein [Thermoleophilia bacterium]
AGFSEWTKLNREPIPPKAADPHLGEKDVFTTATPAEAEAVDGGADRYPDGTIIVKSAVRPDGDFVGLVAVMRKVRGLDPRHNDWEFVEYTRESRESPFEVIARDAVCWTCHEVAKPTDYVYTRRG